ncbi:hypothetical protein [Aureibacillus halotolerans]|uniref:Uncharacterized protein n=1 Tax=Aureibacillus halotolerans TaxID=1508390 RepID=A0A4V3D655_9BACI|nr:hypothetical protein [Aureibacillus halotolerans]TDQ42577.1 hypothetical protein EV213_1015 [Aureibacillus halotolerans]
MSKLPWIILTLLILATFPLEEIHAALDGETNTQEILKIKHVKKKDEAKHPSQPFWHLGIIESASSSYFLSSETHTLGTIYSSELPINRTHMYPRKYESNYLINVV